MWAWVPGLGPGPGPFLSTSCHNQAQARAWVRAGHRVYGAWHWQAVGLDLVPGRMHEYLDLCLCVVLLLTLLLSLGRSWHLPLGPSQGLDLCLCLDLRLGKHLCLTAPVSVLGPAP